MARKILIYTNHFSPENFKVNEIANTLNNGENIIKVITCLPNYPSGKLYDGYGFFKRTKERQGKMTIRRLPLILRGSGSKLRLVLNYISYFFSVLCYTLYLSIKRERYDIVFVHHTSPIFIAISPIVYKFFNRSSKLILWDLDIWPDTLEAIGVIRGKRMLKTVESFIKFIYSKYDHILVGSKSFVEIVSGRVKNVPVSYFPNWAEDVFLKKELFTPDPEPSFPSGLKIMFAGNIGQAQDINNVFKSALNFRDKNVHWLIVGDGRMRKWLEDEVTRNNMQKQFHFYGNHAIKYMPYFFSQADVMLVSLADEAIFKKTVPAKLQAYLAFEKPILGMLSGEGAQIIKESGSGWVADSGDHDALTERVNTILSLSDKALAEHARSGKIYFDKHFKKELRFNQLEQIFKDS